MKGYDSCEETVEIRRLKSLINTEYYPRRDYSDKIMKQIEQLGSSQHAPRKAPILSVKRVAVVIGIILLTSGFTYAAKEWLNLRDKAGNTVMEIKQTELSIPAEQTRVLAEVKANLAPGESAVVYFGSKEEVQQGTTDQILWTQAPVKYEDWNSFKTALRGPLANSRLSIDVPDGYEFQGAEIYLNYLPSDGDGNSFIFAQMPDGLEYAYSTRQPVGQITSASLTYRNGEQDICYNVSYSEKNTVTRFFDMEPSKDAIVNVNGTEAYYYSSDSEAGLLWVDNGESVSMEYMITGTAATKQQLIEFAKRAIPAE
ncbi:DUF4367 domain-containing protein [Paenibacillus sp. J2TS4]|uniref:DUF4367 domain-containing protein n=1 Tax=Paenibacillus sp. J2TS4 TaxID=2807194 RepID=UPI001B2F61AC|nr:DUF4367 domain-containing protein [Paenibacillus sp. J2TS4]GIP32551.1 hypothetical protein J2TS4_17610 [Paenibacillus sp. J2TS4]